MGGACSTCVCGGEEKRMQGFDGEPEGKRPLGRSRCRWEDNNDLVYQLVIHKTP